MMGNIGKYLVFTGAALTVAGILLVIGSKLSWFGRLPGDIYIQKKDFTFIFPITTCILLSVVFSLVLTLLRKR
ncbi:MAG: DUF2905 domain-containing protein [Candidatus Omnitrophota bacterium]